jgi:hypothetical protein
MGSGNKPVDPDTHDRVPTAEDKAAVVQILTNRFPTLKDQPILSAHVCQSDNTLPTFKIRSKHPPRTRLLPGLPTRSSRRPPSTFVARRFAAQLPDHVWRDLHRIAVKPDRVRERAVRGA